MVDGYPLKVGIISFAHVHASAYVAAMKDYHAVTVRATDPGPHPAGEERGFTLAQRLGVDYADSVDELMAWGPDAVIITSENARHREFVEIAANAGAHVLCEKPLATTWDDGLAIAEAVTRAGVLLMVAFPVRFSDSFDRLRRAYADGALGELLSVRASNNGMLPTERAWFTDPALSGGGALVDHVVHIVDLLDALMHATPLAVTAIANRILHADGIEVETAGLVTIAYDNGVTASVDCSWSLPDTAPVWGDLKLTVVGTGGSVDIDVFGAAARGLHADSGRPIVRRYGANPDDAMLRSFLYSVQRNQPTQSDISVGLRTLSIVLAAQESEATGRTIAISGSVFGPAGSVLGPPLPS